MTRDPKMSSLALIVLGAAVLGCSDSDTCDLTDSDACDDGLVCEAVAGSEPTCFPETALSGQVVDATSQAPVVGARVVALDAETNAAASNVVLTDGQGRYRLPFRFTRSTEQAADVTSRSFTLRVSAEAFQDFPSPIRQAVPVQVTRADDPASLPTNTRDVALLPLQGADPATLGSIAGKVRDAATGVGGVLVVADSGAGAVSAVTDSSGSYVVLNLPAGTWTVSGFVGGREFEPATAVALAAGEDKTNVNLAARATPRLSTVSGGINVVDGSGKTAEPVVVLALASTGEVPTGLRSGTPADRFSLTGVPPGTYDLLASYNNDGLVLDPDPQQLPRPIRVTLPDDAPGGTLDVGNFKVTSAIRVIEPGAELGAAPVAAAGLTLKWEDDAGEDFYSIEVFDAFGTRLWGDPPDALVFDPATRAPKNTSQWTYAGPTLEPGQTYQWRVTSFTSTPVLKPLAQSENLRGIFTIAP